MRVRVAVVSLVLLGMVQVAGAQDFSGSWDTTYGLLDLVQDGETVSGVYSYGGGSTVNGTIQDGRLVFNYQEPMVGGEGWYELAEDGDSFYGEWREEGTTTWYAWTGIRSGRSGGAPQTGFSGLFDTTYGRMRLSTVGESVQGTYSFAGGSTVEGTVEGSRFTFRYQEPDAAGQGYFEISEDGDSFAGSWQLDGSASWSDWTGERVRPEPGKSWLVVLEAPWETSLAEQEYAFGDMLRAYFARMPNVEVRHRRLYDRPDFFRATGELGYLAEPVAVLIASHGLSGNLVFNGETLGAEDFATALVGAPNVFLLHFSSCETMVGTVGQSIVDALPEGRDVAISGYATSVDWSASALIEFLYLDLVLGRGLSPEAAAAIVQDELGFAGDVGTPASPLGAAMFRYIDTTP